MELLDNFIANLQFMFILKNSGQVIDAVKIKEQISQH